jgi:hypothetical protein
MAREKTDPYWELKTRELKEEHRTWGAVKIAAELAKDADGRKDLPSPRTIGRFLDAFEKLTPAERAIYGRFEWPTSMELGFVPWEASRVALDVLRNNLYRYRTRPTIAYVRWHWRVSLASPALDFDLRDAIVINMLAARDESLVVYDESRLDLLLAFEPWRNELLRTMYDETFPEHPWTRVEEVPDGTQG